MSARSEKLEERIDDQLSTSWNVRDGTVVPTTDTVTLKDGAVKLEATFLYADLAASGELAAKCPWQTTAKIIRAFLACSTSLIRDNGGEIRSFDGDRVMGIFIGDRKNSTAMKCAREIFWSVEKQLGPIAKDKFKSIREGNIKIKCGIGVDSGTSRAVRAGIRDNSDLIWIGEAPSFSAKMSDIREYPYCVFISKAVYNKANDQQKFPDGEDIWESRTYKGKRIYRSKWLKEP